MRDLNFFQQRISRRFIWNRPHRPIGRPNWPNRPFFEWRKKFFSKSWKMTQIPAKLCRPEVADASNLGRKHVQLVPKLLLHSQNVQKYVLHVYLWNKTSLTKFFSKKLLQNWKKIHIFSEVNPLEKIEKKIFFQVWNLVIFFSKNKTLRSTLPHTSVPWKNIKWIKSSKTLKKKIFFEIFLNFSSKKNALFLCKKKVQKFLSNEKCFFRK